MKSVALIIAQKKSNRLENKNFRDFCGKPMFVWNVEKALRIFEKVYVSSNYDFILQEAEKLGAVPIRRPEELCGDVPNIPVYQHAFKYMQNPEIIVAIQANSPTIKESLIRQAKDLMEKYKFDEFLTSHPYKEGTTVQNYKYYGSIWAIRADRLRNYGDPYTRKPEILLMDDSVDIHTIEDFKKAEKQQKYAN